MAEKKINRLHPQYTANIGKWTLFNNSYYGDGGFETGGYLVRYDKEGVKKFDARKKIAYYVNFCSTVVDTYTGHLFKKTITRKTEQEKLTRFLGSVNKNGDKTFDELMQEAATAAGIYGFCYVAVDKPNQTAATKLEEEQNNIRAYAYTVTPENVVDWAVDENCDLKWVKVKEFVDVDDDHPLAERKTITRYRIWYRDKWELYDHEGGLTDSGEYNTGGKVPFVPVYNNQKVGKTIIGVSDLQNIAPLNKRLYNLLSELDELLRMQTFAILTYPNSLDDEDVKLGTDRILTYDPAGGGKPEYISPSNVSTKAYEERIKAVIDAIYRVAKLNYTGGVQKSGVALAFEFEKTHQALLKKAGNLEDAEKKIIDMVAKWEEIESDYVVNYPDDFGISDTETELKIAFDALSLGLGDKYNKWEKKKIARGRMRNEDEATIKEVEDDIDEQDDVTASGFEEEETNEDEQT
jgi:hypothetical protein